MSLVDFNLFSTCLRLLLNSNEMAKQGLNNGNVMSNCGEKKAIVVLAFLSWVKLLLCIMPKQTLLFEKLIAKLNEKLSE